MLRDLQHLGTTSTQGPHQGGIRRTVSIKVTKTHDLGQTLIELNGVKHRVHRLVLVVRVENRIGQKRIVIGRGRQERRPHWREARLLQGPKSDQASRNYAVQPCGNHLDARKISHLHRLQSRW